MPGIELGFLGRPIRSLATMLTGLSWFPLTNKIQYRVLSL